MKSFLVLILLAFLSNSLCKYSPTWESLDSRPIPSWFDEAKIGIFLHWGVYSVPSLGAWFWKHWKDGESTFVDYMASNYRPNFTYQDFAPNFRAEFFDPDFWAELFDSAGAKYIVLTSKHHEGFTMWPSKYSWNWNVMDVGPQRDLLGDLAKSIRSKTSHIRFGIYHSLYEWFNPLYLQDKANQFKTNKFVKTKTMPELYELVMKYKPEIVWSDGEWEASEVYWDSKNFLTWLVNESPVKDTVLYNDRWGNKTQCKHGSFYNCHDRYNPGTLQDHKWENCMTLDKTNWAYVKTHEVEDYLSIEELLKTIVETITFGGNILINTGPTPDGRIPPIMEERLRQMGEWLGVNGEGVYGSQVWEVQKDVVTDDVWYTQNKHINSVYAFILTWPGDVITLGAVMSTAKTKIEMLGNSRSMKFKSISKGLQIVFPSRSEVKSKWAWVIRMTNVKPKF